MTLNELRVLGVAHKEARTMTVGELRELLAQFTDSQKIEVYTEPRVEAEIASVSEENGICCIDVVPVDADEED